ncbi:zinc finger BED domain-containing protein 1-like [Scomber scombrus]|uniref:Zinc finger BED domain-containing protein 1-like n=1 Tax=Scomber scombrus TaxID=13677 RepID=A0AAV1PFJ1_SCOSC
MYLLWKSETRLKAKRCRRFWVHDILRTRTELGEFHRLLQELRLDDGRFQRYYPAQVKKLTEETQVQSASQLWHNARKLRLTASTAKRVPKRSTTNPQKFLSEHLHPTFTGNTATKYVKENEDKVIQVMEAQGHNVEKRGLVVGWVHDLGSKVLHDDNCLVFARVGRPSPRSWFPSCHASVKERVRHTTAVCLTTDCWTSRTTESYMSVTCHFLEDYDMGGLKSLSETVEKVKHIVDHFHRSTLSAEKLKATLWQMGLPDLKLLQDCPTQWNSTFYMLQRFVRLRDAIITTLALVNSSISTLNHDEWEAIEEACEVLQPFEETTVEISAESYVTASKIIILARGLQRLTANYLRTGRFKQPLVVSLLSTLNAEMAKSFHRIEFHTLLSESSILDPRFKRKAFSDDQAANEAIQRLTHAAAAAQVTITNPSQQEVPMEQGDAAGQPREVSQIWGDFDEQVSGLVSHISPSTEATLEIRSFLQEALIPRSCNPLTWWKNRSVIYPRLTRVMVERLCVLATSLPSERVFSKMGQIISEKRSRLSASKAQNVMFLHANLK